MRTAISLLCCTARCNGEFSFSLSCTLGSKPLFSKSFNASPLLSLIDNQKKKKSPVPFYFYHCQTIKAFGITFQEGRKQKKGGKRERNEVCISSLSLSVFVLNRPNDFVQILPVGGMMNGCVSFIILRNTINIKYTLDKIKFTKTKLTQIPNK